MSDLNQPITEDDLHAFVDHLADPDRLPAIERHLRDNPDDATKVAAYRAQRDALRVAFAFQENNPAIPSRLNPLTIQRAVISRRTMWRAAAAVVLAFGAGGGGGWALHQQLSPPPATTVTLLMQEAFANHAVFAADRRRPTELGAEQRDDLAKWVSNRINRPVTPPDLNLAGYRYFGGRLAATEFGPAGMFMYQNEQNVRLTIFVRPIANEASRPPISLRVGTLEGCGWIEQGIGYAVIAPLPAADVHLLVEGVRARIAGAS